MTSSIFSGTLYFDDDSSDRITVNRFIVRDKEISFHLSATWNGTTTLIELDGIALKIGSRFESGKIHPKPIDSGFYPVTIKINEMEPFEEGVSIAGIWKTQTSEIPFSGDLELLKQPRHRA